MPVTRGQGNPDWTVEETILALDLLLRRGLAVPPKDDQAVQDLSRSLRALPIHPSTARRANFRNPDGVYLKLQNLLSASRSGAGPKGVKTSKTDREVWARFAGHPDEVRGLAITILIASNADDPPTASENDGDVDDDRDGFWEGAYLTRQHRRRERKRGLRVAVLRRLRRSADGVACACCNLRASTRSHSMGIAEAAFEVHHAIPLANLGSVRTTIRDVVLLCANCHRMLHAAMRAERCWISVAELQIRLGLCENVADAPN